MRARVPFILAIPVAVACLATSAVASNQATRWFHSPSGNIECEVASGGASGGYVYCQTFTPLQTVTLRRSGRMAVCSRGACSVGNGPENASVLGYDRSVRVGVFRCSSSRSGVRCVVVTNGHGFTIARAGIKTF